MIAFSDIDIFVKHVDNYKNHHSEDNISPLYFIQLLKQNLMKKLSGIPFSGNFEYVSTFGDNLNIKTNNNKLKSLQSPYDIKIDNKLKLVFVADYSNRRIIVFDLNGNYLYDFTTQGEPESLFIDQFEDRIFFSCKRRETEYIYGIYSCNKKGENLTKIYESDKQRVFAITMDTITNYIYASDIDANKIIVIDLNGNFKFEINGSGLEYGTFGKPYSLTFNSKRELLVSDSKNRIQVFDCQGKFIKYINGPFNINWGVSVDTTNDNILVADFINQLVHCLDKDGKLIKTMGREELKYPIQLDYCSVNGYVYVCGESSCDVQIFK